MVMYLCGVDDFIYVQMNYAIKQNFKRYTGGSKMMGHIEFAFYLEYKKEIFF